MKKTKRVVVFATLATLLAGVAEGGWGQNCVDRIALGVRAATREATRDGVLFPARLRSRQFYPFVDDYCWENKVVEIGIYGSNNAGVYARLESEEKTCKPLVMKLAPIYDIIEVGGVSVGGSNGLDEDLLADACKPAGDIVEMKFVALKK